MKKIKTIRSTLTVSRKEYITSRFVRIYFTGEDIPLIANTTVGVNNKILIPPKGLKEIHFPEYDYEKRRWKPQPKKIRPTVRTYTHRGIDVSKNEIWIDFAIHGDEGPATKWANNAKPGDILGVMMKNGSSELYTKSDNYLLAGDATAIPVLSVILEDLPASAKGTCILEVCNREEEQDLQTQADIEFIWLHNNQPQRESRLAEAVKQQALPPKARFGYIAAEFSSVRKIRKYLRKEKDWEPEELYAYSYWKAGTAEDKSVTDRQKEKQAYN